MFTRYKGAAIPENYSGVRFRDAYAPPTEMKTHKATPSYTSTRTSVSPTFKSAQREKNQQATTDNRWNENADLTEAQNEYSWNQTTDCSLQNQYGNERNEGDFSNSKSFRTDGEAPSDEFIERQSQKQNQSYCENESDNYESESGSCENGSDEYETKKAPPHTFRELSELISTVLHSIQGDDFLLLAVIFLLLGEEKNEAKGALLPLALLLLYS